MASAIRIKMLGNEIEVDLSDNEITMSTIKSGFLLPPDAVVALWYEVDGETTFCRVRMIPEPCFLLPDDWQAKEFFAESNKASSRPATPFDIQGTIPYKRAKIDEQKEPTAKNLQWFQSLKNYALFYQDDNNVKHSATYAHGSHKQLTREYTEEKPIVVRNYYDEQYCVPAKVVKRDDGLDVVILQAVSTNFLENNPSIVVPEIGTRYLMLGFSNIENRDNPFSLGCGSVTTILHDTARYVGSSGSSIGDSGAGVWNSVGQLIGMNIMVEHNPVKIDKSRDNQQKQYTHAIGGVCVFVPAGTIKAFASEYIPPAPPVQFEE